MKRAVKHDTLEEFLKELELDAKAGAVDRNIVRLRWFRTSWLASSMEPWYQAAQWVEAAYSCSGQTVKVIIRSATSDTEWGTDWIRGWKICPETTKVLAKIKSVASTLKLEVRTGSLSAK